jgi:hypothetical protein
VTSPLAKEKEEREAPPRAGYLMSFSFRKKSTKRKKYQKKLGEF